MVDISAITIGQISQLYGGRSAKGYVFLTCWTFITLFCGLHWLIRYGRYIGLKKEWKSISHDGFPATPPNRIKSLFFRSSLNEINSAWCCWNLTTPLFAMMVLLFLISAARGYGGSSSGALLGTTNMWSSFSTDWHAPISNWSKWNWETNIFLITASLLILVFVTSLSYLLVQKSVIKKLNDIYGIGEVVNSVELESKSSRRIKRNKQFTLAILVIFTVFIYLLLSRKRIRRS